MKSAKNFITIIFLLAFVFQVSAQNEKPKIIWDNLQESYQDFADVKPIIKNIFNKPLYIYPELDSDDILAFDNETNEWIADKYIFTCGNSSYLRLSKSIKLQPNQSLDLSDQLDWEYLFLGPFNDGSLKDKNKA